MKNKITYEEIVYYKYLMRNNIKEFDIANTKLDEIIDSYKLSSNYFEETKSFYNRFFNDEEYRKEIEHKSNNQYESQGKYYDFAVGNICYDYFEKRKEFFDPSLYGNCGDIVNAFVSDSNIHVYLPLLKPTTLLCLLKYNNKLVFDDNLLSSKCNSVFVGLDENDEQINYNDYEFLKKYNFITSANITKEYFNVALGLERLSDDGVMVYNTFAVNLYKNDSKSYLFRKYLIDNKLLKAIIFSKSFTRKEDYEVTYIITKEANEKVVFIDAGTNLYRNFYNISPFSDDYEFTNEFMHISVIADKQIENYGISSVVSFDTIKEKDYKFDFDEYIITNKSKQRRPLNEIRDDMLRVYEKMEDNLW